MSDPATARTDRLRQLIDPSRTAVVTMELQNGVVGDDALLPALTNAVRAVGLLGVAGSVCRAARSAGIRVVHATAEMRPDGAGSAVNSKLLALADKRRRETGKSPNEVGTRGAQVVDELGLDERDIVVSRLHGMTPFVSTPLDQILRNLGVRTVVLMGVSVNIGILGATINAVDLGYQVVVVRDAVAGIPADYASAVIENSLSLISTVASSHDILTIWNEA